MGIFNDIAKGTSTPQATQPSGGIFSQVAAQQNKPSSVRKFADDIARPFSEIGGEILQRVMPEKINSVMKPKSLGTGSDVARITSGKQLAGNVLEAGSYAIPGAGLATGSIFKGVAKNVGLGALSGQMYGTGQGLTEGKSIGDSLKQGVPTALMGGAIQGTVPLALKGFSSAVKLAKTPKGQIASTIVNEEAKRGTAELLSKNKSVANKVREAQKLKNVDFNEIISDPQVYRGLKVNNNKVVADEAIDTVSNRIETLLDAKRAMLPEVDRLVAKVPRDVVRQKAYNDIIGKYTPADEAGMLRAIDAQIDALPKEISISDLDKLRARFRASARNAKGMQKSSSEYSALENATRDTVFEVTDNLPVPNAEEYKTLNKYIKDMIDTQGFLEKTLNGQVVKMGRLGSLTGRVVGAIAGSNLGVLGTIAGSEAGGVIANILTNNNLGSSIKMKLIKEITDDPKIIAQATKLLGDLKSAELLRLPMPSGKVGATGKEVIYSNSSRSDRAVGFPDSTPSISRQNTANIITKNAPNSSIPGTLPQKISDVNTKKKVVSLEQEAKGKIVSSQNEWVKDTFWGKSIRNDAIETTIPISEIGDGKLVGIRQANVTDSGVKEWVARIKKGERPTVLIGNKKSGDKGIVVLDGNHRLEAYRQLGIKEIPIVDNTGGKLKRK